MTHKLALAAAFSALFAAGLVASNARADEEAAPKPCVTKSFKLPKVAAACKAGGQPAAKKLMKAAAKKAKEAGESKDSMKCNACHDLKTYTLKGSDPVGGIKKWL